MFTDEDFVPDLGGAPLESEDFEEDKNVAIDELDMPPAALAALIRELHWGRQRQLTMAKIRQQRVFESCLALDPTLKTESALGRPWVKVDPVLWHAWGEKIGYDALTDEKEMGRFIRDTPELRRPNLPKRCSYLVDGYRPPEKGELTDGYGRRAA